MAPSRSTAAPIASIAAPFVTGVNVTALFGNLFMLQDVLTPTRGSNGPLWSLSYEWWYYCLFAFALAAIALPFAIGSLSLRSNAFDRLLSDASYSLYLVHWLPL